MAANDPVADVFKLRDHELMRWPYPRIPAIGHDLPASYTQAEEEFDQRVKAQFPTGSSEADLIKELHGQGFRIDQSDRLCKAATVTRGLLIKKLWSVRWRAKDGKIEQVWGVYGAIAL